MSDKAVRTNAGQNALESGSGFDGSSEKESNIKYL